MSKKLESLKKKAIAKGWDLIKIPNGNYIIFKRVEGEGDENETRFNLKDVELFINKL